MWTEETVTFVDSVTDMLSGNTTIIFDSSFVELTVALVTVNLALNPDPEGERYLIIGLRLTDPVGVPPGKFQFLLVGLPTEIS
jgi:hypothetical protein